MYKTIFTGLFLIILFGCKPPEVPQDIPKIEGIAKVQVEILTPQVYQQTIRTFSHYIFFN